MYITDLPAPHPRAGALGVQGPILTSYCGGKPHYILDYVTILIKGENVILESPESLFGENGMQSRPPMTDALHFLTREMLTSCTFPP